MELHDLRATSFQQAEELYQYLFHPALSEHPRHLSLSLLRSHQHSLIHFRPHHAIIPVATALIGCDIISSSRHLAIFSQGACSDAAMICRSPIFPHSLVPFTTPHVVCRFQILRFREGSQSGSDFLPVSGLREGLVDIGFREGIFFCSSRSFTHGTLHYYILCHTISCSAAPALSAPQCLNSFLCRLIEFFASLLEGGCQNLGFVRAAKLRPCGDIRVM
ncbi:hypothetical protein C8J56DRAFT_951734 [Mycena floridula]|nr:hypothetical protein C8J56DRAFT_951734 [Mycena floridula]